MDDLSERAGYLEGGSRTITLDADWSSSIAQKRARKGIEGGPLPKEKGFALEAGRKKGQPYIDSGGAGKTVKSHLSPAEGKGGKDACGRLAISDTLELHVDRPQKKEKIRRDGVSVGGRKEGTDASQDGASGPDKPPAAMGKRSCKDEN